MELTNRQKKDLCELAREAWRAYPDREALLAVNSELGETAVFTGWRRAEQARCMRDGRESLTEATQADFAALMAHWWGLRADWARHSAQEATFRRQELYWYGRSMSDEHRRARFVLQRELRSAGLPAAYAEAICRRQNRCPLADASSKMLWRLVYTVRTRARAKNNQNPPKEEQ